MFVRVDNTIHPDQRDREQADGHYANAAPQYRKWQPWLKVHIEHNSAENIRHQAQTRKEYYGKPFDNVAVIELAKAAKQKR